jgi:hypothetical protein
MAKNIQYAFWHIGGVTQGAFAMELVDLYVNEVGRHLPEKMRADLEQEIRSMIEDTLEDESRQQGRPVDDEMVVTVLKRLGPPQKMAASYQPPRYLIGPALFPAYFYTLRIVLSFVIAIAIIYSAISWGLAIGQSVEVGAAILRSVGQGISWFINAVFWSAGIITLIFAILQWTEPNFKPEEAAWDPRKLKSTPNPERIKPAGTIVEIGLTLFALVLFNFFPQWLGIGTVKAGHWVIVPVLAPAYLALVPWLSVVWILNIFLRIALLREGRWTVRSHWFDVALDVLAIAVSIRILLLPAIVAFPADMVARLGWGIATPEAMATAAAWVNTILRVLVGIGALTQTIELIKKLYRLLLKEHISMVAPLG